MKIGIIGTGWVTDQHLEALSTLGVELVGVAGRNRQRREALAFRYGGQPYDSYQTLIASQKPDGIIIALPPHLHGEVEEYCAGRVAGVLIEKPLANAAEPARRALAALSRAGTLVSVGYQNRYRAGARRVREFFAASADKPKWVQGWWVGDMPSPPWWRDRTQSGGQFVEQCTHTVDLARFVVGDVSAVHAFAARGDHSDPGTTVEDAITVNARFTDGAVGTFSTGCFASPDTPLAGIGLTIASRSAVARFSGWGFDAVLESAAGTERFPAEPAVFALQAQAFLAALESGDRSLVLSDYADGARSLQVGLAANESLASGGVVEIHDWA